MRDHHRLATATSDEVIPKSDDPNDPADEPLPIWQEPYGAACEPSINPRFGEPFNYRPSSPAAGKSTAGRRYS